MSEEKAPARPRQVTMAVVMAVVGSLVLVVGLFDTLGRMRSADARDAIDEFLGQAPGNTLGVSTGQVLAVMQALAFVSGALAAMGLVFAIYVIQRHRGARIGFTVVAGLLVLTVPVAGLMPFFLVVAAVMLWSQPARDWFAGRVPVAAGASSAAALPLVSQSDPGAPTGPPSGPPSGPPRGPEPGPSAPGPYAPSPAPGPYGQPPYGPYGQPPAAPPPSYGQAPQGQAPYGQAPYGQAPYDQSPYGQAPYGQAAPSGYPPPYLQNPYGPPSYGYPTKPARDPDRRPLTVTIAAVLTWLGAGSTALLMLIFAAVLATDSAAFQDQFDTAAQGSDVTLTSDQVMAVGWGIALVFLVWSLAAVVLAIMAIRRSNPGRIGLVVSAVMAALFSLMAIMSVLSAVTLVLAMATVILLFTGGANEWYARRGGSPTYPTAYSGNPYGGYPAPSQPGQPAQPGQQQQPWPPQTGAEQQWPPAAPQDPGSQEPPRRNQPW